MLHSTRIPVPGWEWGTGRQVWACRLSHLLGLVAVLALIWFIAAR